MGARRQGGETTTMFVRIKPTHEGSGDKCPAGKRISNTIK